MIVSRKSPHSPVLNQTFSRRPRFDPTDYTQLILSRFLPLKTPRVALVLKSTCISPESKTLTLLVSSLEHVYIKTGESAPLSWNPST
jgi:hypothetical protein